MSLCIARSRGVGGTDRAERTGNQLPCFGKFLNESRSQSADEGNRMLRGIAVAVRFGISQSIRALFSHRSIAMTLEKGLKALANPTRLRVLELLKNPAAFDGPRGADGRPIGVTAKALVKHLRCAQPTLNEQMQVLEDVGLVESRRVGRWVVYARDEERIRQLKQTIIDQLLPPA